MARMIPDSPVRGANDAEVRVYEALRDQLPRDYVAFHSVAWAWTNVDTGAADGEADFVIVHPRQGILVGEVKGYRGRTIEYDGRRDTFLAGGTPFREDPFRQVTGNKHTLLRRLKQEPELRSRPLTMGQVVFFPNSDVPANFRSRLDAPREMIIDARDLGQLQASISRVFDYWKHTGEVQGPPGYETGRALERVLAPTIVIPPTWEDEEQELIRLTLAQYQVLDTLMFERRATIAGFAGSGKTTLACEQARRLRDQRRRVLLTCFNRNLAGHLIADDSLHGVDIFNFHSLARSMAQNAGLQRDLDAMSRNIEYQNDALPSLLARATAIRGAQYDAIVVDEAQDFRQTWWPPLLGLLRNRDQDPVYVFYDSNQNLYDTAVEGQLPLPPDLKAARLCPLSRNCRNTRRIHQAVLSFYKPVDSRFPEPQSVGPDGRVPAIFEYGTAEEMRSHLDRILRQLVDQEGVDAQDIAVLTPLSWQRSVIRSFARVGGLRVTDAFTGASGDVYCTTIHGFKGLERRIVILAEISPETIAGPKKMETLLYVGCSRARSALYILADRRVPAEVREKFLAAGP